MRDYDQLRVEAEAAWERRHPPDQPQLKVGISSCSLAAGASEVMAAIRAEVERHHLPAVVNQTGCLGMCYKEVLFDIAKPGRPPIIYGEATPQMVPQLIESYIVEDDPRVDLAVCVLGEEGVDGIPSYKELPFFVSQRRLLLRRCGFVDPEEIDDYIANGGYSALHRALTAMSPEEVIAQLKVSGLRGRGGAAFPAGRKWESCRAASGYPKYIICNADEGDPGSFVDRTIIEGDPHAVLEGMLIAAYAIGSAQGYIYVRVEYPLAAKRLEIAIQQARERELLGQKILGRDFSFDIEIRRGAGSYVCGESSALMSSIEGIRGMPRLKRPRSVERGLWGKPTSLNNVETLANVSLIINRGGEWYASIGTGKSKGTKLFSLSGDIKRIGVVEVPMGIPLREVIYEAGGGLTGDSPLKAINPGGPMVGFLPASQVDLPVDFEAFAEAGSSVGSGGLLMMDERRCMVDMARFFLAFAEEESCGRCSTCRLGTRRIRDLLDHIAAGQGRPHDLEIIEVLGSTMSETTLCGLGQTAAMSAITAIRHFREEYEAHIHEKRCPAKVCAALVQYRIHADQCTGCDLCRPVCPTQAISGEEGQVYTIDQVKCIRCDICLSECPYGAIVVD